MRSDLLNIKVDSIDLNGLIKTALKAKPSKKLTKKQSTAIELLREFGFEVSYCDVSAQGYFKVSKYGRDVYISMITDTSKAGIFKCENNHETCLNRHQHSNREFVSWNDCFSSLHDIFNKIDFVKLLTKFKYSQHQIGETAKIEKYKWLKRQIVSGRNQKRVYENDINSIEYELESIKKRLSEAKSHLNNSQSNLNKAIKEFDDFKQNIFTK